MELDSDSSVVGWEKIAQTLVLDKIITYYIKKQFSIKGDQNGT